MLKDTTGPSLIIRMEGHSLKMVEQEDSTMNGQVKENQEIDKKHESKFLVELPLIVMSSEGK